VKDLAIMGCGFPLHGSGRVGRDENGDRIIRDLADHGIESGGVLRTEATPTSYTEVMSVQATGRRTFFHQRGANATFAPEDCVLEQYRAKILHLGYFGLLDRFDASGMDGRNGHERLLGQASKLGFLTSADLVTDEGRAFDELVAPSLPFLDILFMNEFEGELLSGITATDPSNGPNPRKMEQQGRYAVERGVRKVVVVHSTEGAIACGADGSVFLQGAVRIPPERVRGAAGAGDALSAGFLLGVHEGWRWEECLELGVCAAAASLEDPTCSAGLKPWKQCLEQGRAQGYYNFA
jgi:sugar/nucleoside kinase (ribokinase family)